MRHKTIFRAGLCVLLLTIICYSATETITLKDTAEVNEDKTALPAPTDSNSASEVIISLGDKKLTMEHISWLHPNPDGTQIAIFAKWWLESQLLYAEAEKRGITDEPKTRFFSEMMRRSIFGKELESRVKDAVEITDEDVLAYYEKNKETDPKLMERGYLGFSHIRAKTLKEAQAALERIKAGEDISKLAKELSISSDAKRGGQVRERPYTVVEKRFGTKFLEAIKAAKQGELIGPIEVEEDGGYEVARKKSEIKPVPKPFEEVKDRLKSQLQRREKDKAFRSLVDSLKNKAADKIVKSSRLIEAEKAKAAAEQPKRLKPPPPKPEPKPTKPTAP